MSKIKKNNDLELLSIKQVFHLVKHNASNLLIGVSLLLFIAFLVNRYSNESHYLETKVFIKEPSSYSNPVSVLAYDLGQNRTEKVINDEIMSLKSYSLINEVIKELNFEINYSIIGNIRNVETFEWRPVDIHFLTDKRVYGSELVIEIKDDDHFLLKSKDNSLKKVFQFGEKIIYNGMEFIIKKNNSFPFSKSAKKPITKINLVTPDKMTQRYLSKLDIEIIKKDANAIKISTEGECPDKEVAFLNKLTNLYIEKNLENKNIAHENTIKFIDKQLKETSDSLAFIEFQLQQFKKKNNVTNLSIESQYFYEELNEYNKERAELLIQNKYYDYLSDYLISTSDLSNIVVPVTYGVKDNILNSMIENLVNLQIEKNIRNPRNSLENPAINDISFQISDLKKAIIELISNQRKANQILLNDIASRKVLLKIL